MSSGSLFPIGYGLQGGRPAVELAFEVHEDGTCLVNVLTPDSVDQTGSLRIGRFRTTLPPATLRRLALWARGTTTIPGESLPSGSSWRTLSLADAEEIEVEPSPPVENELLEAASRALDTPVGAVEFGVEGTNLVVRGLGAEGFRIVLFDNQDTTYYGSIWRYDP